MKRKILMISMIISTVILACVGCGKEEGVSTESKPAAVRTEAAVATTPPEVLCKPVAESGNLVVKREVNKWQGVFGGKEKKNPSLDITCYIHRVTEEEIWFSLGSEKGINWKYLHGKKTEKNTYEYRAEQSSHANGTIEWDSKINGEIVLKNNKILLTEQDDGDSEFTYEMTRKNEKNADTSHKVLELARCLNQSYTEVKKKLSSTESAEFQIEKKPGTDKISSIKVSVDREGKWDKNLGYFQLRGVGIWCSKEECKEILGPPTEEHTYDLRYRSEDGYELRFAFYKDHVEKMEIEALE